ncbi:MAG TPA: single-stranded DNA-binding protein [Solirubrobacteraceae bacterium]|jgi:single-strand DNA-binding protein
MSSFTINRVVLVGRLTKDPELRALPSGISVCILRLACNSSRRDAEGTYQEKPNFFDVSVYNGAAESVNRYTHKGSRVAIDGRLEWREWETSDQQKRQAVSVVADTVLFLDAPGERSATAQQGGDEPGNGGGISESHEERELVGVGADTDDDLVF